MKTDPVLYTHPDHPGVTFRVAEHHRDRGVLAKDTSKPADDPGVVLKKYNLQKLPHTRKHPR